MFVLTYLKHLQRFPGKLTIIIACISVLFGLFAFTSPGFAEDPEVPIPLDPGIEIIDMTDEGAEISNPVPSEVPSPETVEFPVALAPDAPVEAPADSSAEALQGSSPDESPMEARPEEPQAAEPQAEVPETGSPEQPTGQIAPGQGEPISPGATEGQETPEPAPEEEGLPVTLEPLPETAEPAEEEDVQAALNPRFQVKEEGTVIDLDTALMWTRDGNVFRQSMPWQVAREYVKEMNAGKRENYGYADWRLPTLKELSSLFEEGQAYPALSVGHPFKNVKNSYYWSSSGGFNVVGYAWVADMGSGMVRYDYISFCNFSYAWPVRSTALTPRKTQADISKAHIVPSQLGLSSEDFMCAENMGKKPPKPPIGVTATAVSPSELVLSWQKPEGAEEIAWYNVYRGNDRLQSSPSLHFTVEDINPNSIQCYSVTAYDTNNLESERSAEVCARTWATPKSGTVWTSGYNAYGQLGNGTFDDQQGLGLVEGLQNIIKIDSGVEHVLALREDGTVWAWGRNQRGQLGDGTLENRKKPVQVPGLTDVIDISAGWYHSLALKSDGTVWAWGRNYYGQLGDGTKYDRVEPVQVKELNNIEKITTGWYHNLALRADGTLWAWGWNLKGQLGTGNYETYSTPTKLALIKDVVGLGAGMYHSLAMDKDGAVWAWGSNEFGQIGNGNYASIPLPVKLDTIAGVRSISAGMHFSLVSKLDGSVWGWGRNDYAQLGMTEISKSADPIRANGIEDVIKVAAGAHHSLALHDDGTVTIWGWNYELGEKQSGPRPLSGIHDIKDLDAGIHFNTVLKQ